MPNLIKSNIDLAKIHGAKVVKKDADIWLKLTDSKLFEGKNGALYLDLAQFETTNDQYGNDWRISQDLPKELRDAGVERGPILGNGKNKAYGSSAPAKANTPPPARSQKPVVPPADDSSEIPF
jgi:hypothetical protein